MIENMMNGMFGKVQAGLCRLSFNGETAIKCKDGKYRTYNTKLKRLTNCERFVLPIADDFFFVMPTTKVKPGDIILANGSPKCVVSVDDDEIKCVNYDNSTLETVLPERHVFMGKTYFYGKIVSLMGKGLKSGGGMKGMMKLMMLSQMMGGKGNPLSGITGGSSEGGLGSMLPMLMIMGGGLGDLSEMFDFDLDVDDEEVKVPTLLNENTDKKEN